MVGHFENFSTAQHHIFLHVQVLHIDSSVEMATFMGEGITGKAISWQFYDRFKPIGDRMAEMKANGEDPGKIDLDSVKGAPGKGRKKGQAVFQDFLAQHSTCFLLHSSSVY